MSLIVSLCHPQIVNLGKNITDFSVEGRDDAIKDNKEKDDDGDQEQLDEEMGK